MSFPLVRLGSLCDFLYGDGLLEGQRRGGKFPVYGSNGVIGWHDRAITKGPTIIVGRKGSIGEIHRSQLPCWPIDTTYYVEATKRPCDLTWLYYALIALDLTRLNKSAAVPGLNREDAYDREVVYPPLPEQQRIAAILERADRLRRLRRYALELSEGYLQAVFVEMFGDPVRNPKGWEIVELGDIGEVQGGLQLSSRRNELPLQAPYLRVANVYRDRLDLSEIKMISLTEGELERLTLQPGDLLLVEGHGNIEEIGRCAIWDGSVPGCVHQNHLIRVRINRFLATGVYVSRYLNGTAGRSYFRDTSNTTSGLNTISTGIVKCCPLMLPPRIDQERFTLVVSKHERLRAQQREALRQAEQLFAALLDRAFRGAL